MMNLHDILNELGLETNALPNITIDRINTLSDATSSEISFLSNKKYRDALTSTTAGAVFVSPQEVEHVPASTIAIVTDEPYVMVAKSTKLFNKPLISDKGEEPKIGEGVVIQPHVHIGRDATIEDGVVIMAGAFIGDRVHIGKGSIIYPNVSVLNDSIIGTNVILNAGAVIGSDGFGFATGKDGVPIKIYHLGNVILEDDVEIGANTTVDRAAYGSTRVGRGTKLDNLIQVAHNVEIGANCYVAAQSGFAGSTKIGSGNLFGAQSGVSGHIEIGDGCTIYARGGVTKNLASGKEYAGFPIQEHRAWVKKEVAISRLAKGK
jgi:UDP-3-O-[3-hydroxymyristoyl] glucosamine N-acyltransferase